MIEELEKALSRAEDEKKKAMKPYDLRIKGLKEAIKNIKLFNTNTEVINTRDKENVSGLNEGE